MVCPELFSYCQERWDWKSECAWVGDEKAIRLLLLLRALWLCRPSVFGIHMTFASETKDEIITIIKQAAGKHRSLWFREIRLPSLLSLKYVIRNKIIAQFFSHVFLRKHRVSNLILIYTPAQALHTLEISKMPKGYIINMTKAADCKLHTRHRLYNFMFSFS